MIPTRRNTGQPHYQTAPRPSRFPLQRCQASPNPEPHTEYTSPAAFFD